MLLRLKSNSSLLLYPIIIHQCLILLLLRWAHACWQDNTENTEDDKASVNRSTDVAVLHSRVTLLFIDSDRLAAAVEDSTNDELRGERWEQRDSSDIDQVSFLTSPVPVCTYRTRNPMANKLKPRQQIPHERMALILQRQRERDRKARVRGENAGKQMSGDLVLMDHDWRALITLPIACPLVLKPTPLAACPQSRSSPELHARLRIEERKGGVGREGQQSVGDYETELWSESLIPSTVPAFPSCLRSDRSDGADSSSLLLRLNRREAETSVLAQCR
jgi:hypothetical protein